MKHLKDLTPEIQAKIPSYIAAGLAGVFDGQRYREFDMDAAIACVNWNYNKAGFASPKVLVAENPHEANLMVMAMTGDTTYTNHNSYLFTMNIYSNVYYQWFKFIHEEFKLPLTVKEDFETCFGLYLKSGIYSACLFDEVCIVVKYPKQVVRDERNELHNVRGQAVDWAYTSEDSKWDCYYIHGVNLSKETFTKVTNQTYTIEDFLAETNEEVKNAVMAMMSELHGENYFHNFISKNLTEIDTYVDKKDEKYLEHTTKGMSIGVYTLFKGTVGTIDFAYVRCYCPSTDRMFFLAVDPVNTNAKDAIASLYRIPRAVVNDIEYIQRQGERFSTVLTAAGKAKLAKLSTEEMADLVGLSGKQYFNLMTYEY